MWLFTHLALLPLTLGAVLRAILGPLPLALIWTIIEIMKIFLFATFGASIFSNIVKFLLIYNQSFINKLDDKLVVCACIFFSLLFSCLGIPMIVKVGRGWDTKEEPFSSREGKPSREPKKLISIESCPPPPKPPYMDFWGGKHFFLYVFFL